MTSSPKEAVQMTRPLLQCLSGVELVTEKNNLYDTAGGVRKHIAAFTPLPPLPASRC